MPGFDPTQPHALVVTAGAVQGVLQDGSLYDRNPPYAALSLPAFSSPGPFTKAQSVVPVVLTPGTTVTPDASASNNFRLSPVQNFTLANAATPVSGQTMSIEIIQDSTGSRIITFGSEYLFATGASKVLSTPASSIDYLSCVRNAANTKWLCSLTKGLS